MTRTAEIHSAQHVAHTDGKASVLTASFSNLADYINVFVYNYSVIDTIFLLDLFSALGCTTIMCCYCVRRLELGLERIRRRVIENVTWSKLMLNGYHKKCYLVPYFYNS